MIPIVVELKSLIQILRMYVMLVFGAWKEPMQIWEIFWSWDGGWLIHLGTVHCSWKVSHITRLLRARVEIISLDETLIEKRHIYRLAPFCALDNTPLPILRRWVFQGRAWALWGKDYERHHFVWCWSYIHPVRTDSCNIISRPPTLCSVMKVGITRPVKGSVIL